MAYPETVSDEPVGPSPDEQEMPANLRRAGYIVAFEGALALCVAIILVVRAALGHDQSIASGYGTAGWFAVIGGGVLAGGVALVLGRRWGRGIAIIAQILLLPVAWALLTGSQLPWLGAPVGIVAIAVLVMLFHPGTVRWLESNDLPPDAQESEPGRR